MIAAKRGFRGLLQFGASFSWLLGISLLGSPTITDPGRLTHPCSNLQRPTYHCLDRVTQQLYKRSQKALVKEHSNNLLLQWLS